MSTKKKNNGDNENDGQRKIGNGVIVPKGTIYKRTSINPCEIEIIKGHHTIKPSKNSDIKSDDNRNIS